MTSYSTIAPLGLSGPCQAKVTLSLLRLSFNTTLTAAQQRGRGGKREQQRGTVQRNVGKQNMKKEAEGAGCGGVEWDFRRVPTVL